MIFLSVDLEKVVRIMPGQNTFQFHRWTPIYGEAREKSFSIIYHNQENEERSLDVISPSGEVYNLWFGGLAFLVQELKQQRENSSEEALYLKSLFDRADADHNGTLTSREIINLISSVNINMPTSRIRELYNKFDTDNSGGLDFQEFVDFVGLLRQRLDTYNYKLERYMNVYMLCVCIY